MVYCVRCGKEVKTKKVVNEYTAICFCKECQEILYEKEN